MQGYEIQTDPFGLIDIVLAPSFLEDLGFPTLTQTPDNSHGLLLSATWLGSHELHSPPLGL